jgi:uncharacterized protein
VAASRPVAITNTSPVSALVGVGHLDLLAALFAKVIVPLEVWDELRRGPDAAEVLAALLCLPNGAVQPNVHPAPVEAAALHAGELAAISLALANPEAWVLLDDGPARKIARRLGLHVVGILGVLIEAKRQDFIAEVRPILENLVAQGFHLSPAIITAALEASGEGAVT